MLQMGWMRLDGIGQCGRLAKCEALEKSIVRKYFANIISHDGLQVWTSASVIPRLPSVMPTWSFPDCGWPGRVRCLQDASQICGSFCSQSPLQSLLALLLPFERLLAT